MLSSVYKRRNGGGSGGHEGFRSSSPAPATVKWKPKAEPSQQAASHWSGSRRASGGREKHKAFVRKRMGRTFSPERLSILPQAGALGMNILPFIGTLRGTVKFYFPEKHPATYSYLREGRL